ncbi:hypothetical protein CPB86DRAFT_787561 [Serendipita vermifera]|nr:hypothetical protein CPB86DRAFT_787561 [Serendipita vermifera]
MVRPVRSNLLGGLFLLVYFAQANPLFHDSLQARRPDYGVQNGNLHRRGISIEDSGLNSQNTPSMNVVTTVPLNNGASSNSTIVANNIVIPHTTLAARPFALGGGDGQTITAGRFQGQVAGRGTRNEIYGSARYGSGFGKYTKTESGTYTYEPDLSLNMAGRNEFPHGFPPISWGNYSGSIVPAYEDISSDGDYPGITSAPFAPFESHEGETRLQAILARRGEQQWFIAADGATMKVLNEVLVLPRSQGGCEIEPTLPVSLATSHAANTIPRQIQEDLISYLSSMGLIPLQLYEIYPWNVLQYYRGCSVMLGSRDYDNTFAHGNNLNDTNYWASTPLNRTGVDMEFLQCLNTTIAAAVPIIDPSLVAKNKPKFQPGAIAGIVIGSVAGVVFLLVAAWFLYRRHHNRNDKRVIHTNPKSAEQPDDSEVASPTVATSEYEPVKGAKSPIVGYGYTDKVATG